MFDPTKEVPNLELCRKLKELGYPQEGGGWYWINPDGKEYFLSYFETSDYLSNMDFKAPLCSEILEIIPAKVEDIGEFRLLKKDRFYLTFYNNASYDINGGIYIGNLPFALVSIIIWLKENGYIKFQERKEV